MSHPASDASTSRARPKRRIAKVVLIAAYMLGLATVPYWMFLGFRSGSAEAGDVALSAAERSRFETISWDALAGFPYDFTMPGELLDVAPDELASRAELIPASVRALTGRDVAIRGFVIPMVMEGGVVRQFILAAKNEIGCCFGDGLAMNQWIVVDVPEGQRFDADPFVPATVLGTIDVGEDIQQGTVMSLYRMKARTVRTS